MTKNLRKILNLLVLLTTFSTASAFADYESHRLGLGVGIAQVGDPAQTYLSVTGEYEYRFDPLLGLGTSVSYVFSDPSLTLLAIPEIYFHPLSNGWYINAAPLFEIVGGSTHLGVRVGTRVPLSLGIVSIIPEVNVDFVNGTRNLLYGIGIAI